MKNYPFLHYFALIQPLPSIVAHTYLTASFLPISPREYLTLAKLREQMVGPYVCPASSSANEVMSQ